MDLLRAAGSMDIKHGLSRQTLPLDVHTQPRLKAGEGSIFQGRGWKATPCMATAESQGGELPSCLPAGKVFSQLPFPRIRVKTGHSQGTGPGCGRCGLKDAWEKVLRTPGNVPCHSTQGGTQALLVPAVRNQSGRGSGSTRPTPQSPAPGQ